MPCPDEHPVTTRSTDLLDKRIPTRNMIYIGDGLTDIPCMKLTKEWGGTSIAVYNEMNDTIKLLLEDKRINYIAKANYEEESELDKIIKQAIDKQK